MIGAPGVVDVTLAVNPYPSVSAKYSKAIPPLQTPVIGAARVDCQFVLSEKRKEYDYLRRGRRLRSSLEAQ